MSRRRVTNTTAYIGPAFGGSGGAFGKGAAGGTESPDNLRSRQTARIVDLIGEGPNVGIVGWTKGIYYDGVPLQNADGSFNFSNAVIQQALGEPDQAVMTGFNGTESTGFESGRVQLKYNIPVVKKVMDTNKDRVRLIFEVPSLQTIDDDGNIKGNSVEWAIDTQNNGGGYQSRGTYKITGKTSSAYQRQVILTLPAPGPWDIRCRRLTADSTSSKIVNDLWWDGYFEIEDSKVNYSGSHVIGTIIDAEQFGSIPSRTYLVDGRKILVPSNYDPITRAYNPPVWNGLFKTAWSNNPAWCLYDMVTNTRYGLGSYFSAPIFQSGQNAGITDIDKWSLYEIAKWCDEPVSNGRPGQYEPRFVCNAVIKDQSEAFDLINALAAIFRGFLYWSGGQMIAVADKPRPVTSTNTAAPNVVGIFSPANVINGVFTYAGSDLRSRHNMVTAKWIDGSSLGEERYSVAEDHISISKYGIMGANIDVLGATSEAQALRSAKWMIYTDTYEGEVVDFSVGLDGAWTKPGDIIAIADPTIAGERRGGRIYSAKSQSQVELDGIVTLQAGRTYVLTCVLDSGAANGNRVETMRVTSVVNANGRSTINMFNAFTAIPKAGTPWLLSSDDLMPTLWRVIAITENDEGTYSINAVAHNPGKWDAIEKNKALTQPDVSNIKLVPDPVTGLKVEESLIQLNVASIGVVALISWTSDAPYWDVDARPENGNWIRNRAVNSAFELQVTEGKWEFQVTPVSLLGRKGGVKTITKTIVGRYANPLKPQNLRMTVQNGVALFSWTPSSELDVKVGGHFELRHSPRTDGSARWDNSTPVAESIPGIASTVSSFYQPGTWFLKTFDIVGLSSPDEAVIIAVQTDESYQNFVRISEQPAWAGTHQGTIRENHSGEWWLVLDYGVYGGLWDDQTNLMDDWAPPAVDIMPGGTPAPEGTYTFANQINMGGIFTVRLSLDMLSTPYFPADPTMDNRAGTVETWLDWDATTTDLDGTAKVFMRSTNVDPAVATATDWSAWVPFTAGDHTGYAHQFRVTLKATAPQNIAVQEIGVIADVSNKVDENKGPLSGGVTWDGNSNGMDILYSLKFQNTPAITVTIQNAGSTEYVVLSNKTRTGFNIKLVNAPVGRKFDWHAIGY